jgi:hypothetical protein
MDFVPVASSNIASVGYDREQKVLGVRFSSGATYLYTGVPEEVHADFMDAASLGSFFADNIKGVYPFSRA